MNPGEIVIIIVLLLWGSASCLILFGSSIKEYFVHRMNDEWMMNGVSPWYVRAAWFVLRPFIGGA